MRMEVPTSDKPKRSQAEWSCRVCGEAVKVNPNTVWIWVVEGGYTMATPDEEEPEDSDCGHHPVGPKCVRHIPAEFRIKLA